MTLALLVPPLTAYFSTLLSVDTAPNVSPRCKLLKVNVAITCQPLLCLEACHICYLQFYKNTASCLLCGEMSFTYYI